tara:strand:- start:218 stop:646 length:429 start_codon:yes stop_codon:yes gene_type:complete
MAITLLEARSIIDAAINYARDLLMKPISVVVLDNRGSMVAAASEDGVSAMRAKIAFSKANAAIQMGVGTRSLMERAEEQPYFIQAINGLSKGEIIPLPGGILLKNLDGNVIGAVGISGDSSENDEKAAIFGADQANLISETG